MSLFSELKRRNVIRAAIAYLAFSWILIQIAEATFPAFNFGSDANRTLIIVLLAGLVPVLVVSWAFDLTPTGFRKDADVDHDADSAVRTGRLTDRLIMVALVLALSYFIIDKFISDPIRDRAREQGVAEVAREQALLESFGDKSLAVLAFEDMSQNADQAYFSDGIAEELLNLLSKIPELRVISRSSSFSFKGKSTAIPAIASQLGVAYILQGSVRLAGNQLRITSQLVEGSSDTTVWSETFDRVLDDVFAIQDEIAAAIVEQMKIKLLAEIPLSARINPEAYTLYLQGKSMADHGVDNLPQAVTALSKALELEPEFVDARLHLSLAYYRIGNRSEGAEIDKYKTLARQSLDMAFELSPENATVNAYLGWNLAEEDGNFSGAAKRFAYAIEKNPYSEDVLRTAGAFVTVIGRSDVALALGKFSVSHNPLCGGCTYNLSGALLEMGRVDQAEEYLRNYMKNGVGGYHSLGVILLQKGDLDGARNAFNHPFSNEFDRDHGNILIRIYKGDTGLNTDVEQFVNKWGKHWPIRAAGLYALIGQTDSAYQVLEESFQEISPFFQAMDMRNIYLSRLHSDPRWEIFKEQAGITNRQLEEIEFYPRLPIVNE
jgi:adenylate cyclase